MTHMKSLGLKVIATAILGLSLVGFGGGDGNGSSSSRGGDTTPTEPTTNIGRFVDSPVEGLKYSTATLSYFTDNQGRFLYKDGEIVTFKIGNFVLGSARGDKLITPLTLMGENDLNNMSKKATNIARILQSLDENSSNSGLIKIPLSLKDLNVSSIDLESDADLNTILQKAQDITSKVYVLKDSEESRLQMKKSIELYNKYEILSVGKTTRPSGTYYFLLNIPENTNIIFDRTGGLILSLDIFDTDLNPVNLYDDWNGGYHNKVKLGVSKSIPAGTYIIKSKHGDFRGSQASIIMNF